MARELRVKVEVTDEMVKKLANAFVQEGWLEQDWDELPKITGYCRNCGEGQYKVTSDRADEIYDLKTTMRWFLEEALK